MTVTRGRRRSCAAERLGRVELSPSPRASAPTPSRRRPRPGAPASGRTTPRSCWPRPTRRSEPGRRALHRPAAVQQDRFARRGRPCGRPSTVPRSSSPAGPAGARCDDAGPGQRHRRSRQGGAAPAEVPALVDGRAAGLVVDGLMTVGPTDGDADRRARRSSTCGASPTASNCRCVDGDERRSGRRVGAGSTRVRARRYRVVRRPAPSCRTR